MKQVTTSVFLFSGISAFAQNGTFKKISAAVASLSKNSLYGIIGVVSVILLAGLLYWLLRKKQKSRIEITHKYQPHLSIEEVKARFAKNKKYGFPSLPPPPFSALSRSSAREQSAGRRLRILGGILIIGILVSIIFNPPCNPALFIIGLVCLIISIINFPVDFGVQGQASVRAIADYLDGNYVDMDRRKLVRAIVFLCIGFLCILVWIFKHC